MKKDKTVCVSGYFDPIHIGHIEYFKLAKALCDRLVVIVNTDRQAVLKKGYVFMPQTERVEIVRSIRYVDEVVLSVDEDGSVCKTLGLIKPDIFAKGGDRHVFEIPEQSVCARLNIKIIDRLGEKTQSSSALVYRRDCARRKRNR